MRLNKSLFCRYARPQNAHLRLVNSAFSVIASLKLDLLFSLLCNVGGGRSRYLVILFAINQGLSSDSLL